MSILIAYLWFLACATPLMAIAAWIEGKRRTAVINLVESAVLLFLLIVR